MAFHGVGRMHQLTFRQTASGSARPGPPQCRFNSTGVDYQLIKLLHAGLWPALSRAVSKQASSGAAPQLLNKMNDDSNGSDALTETFAFFNGKLEQLQSDKTDVQTFCHLAEKLVYLKHSGPYKTASRAEFNATWVSMCNELLEHAPAHIETITNPQELFTVVQLFVSVRNFNLSKPNTLPKDAVDHFNEALQRKLLSSEMICKVRETHTVNRRGHTIFGLINANLKSSRPSPLLRAFREALTSSDVASPREKDDDIQDGDNNSDKYNNSRIGDSVSAATEQPSRSGAMKDVVKRGRSASPTPASDVSVSQGNYNHDDPCFFSAARATFTQKFKRLQSDKIDIETFRQLTDLLLPLKNRAKQCKTVSRDDYKATWTSMCNDLLQYAPAHVAAAQNTEEVAAVINFFLCIRSSSLRSSSRGPLTQYSQALQQKLGSSNMIRMFRERQAEDPVVRNILNSIGNNLKSEQPPLVFHDFYQAVINSTIPLSRTDEDVDDRDGLTSEASQHASKSGINKSSAETDDDVDDSDSSANDSNDSSMDTLVSEATQQGSKASPASNVVKTERSASPTPEPEASVSTSNNSSKDVPAVKVYVTAPEPVPLTRFSTLPDITDHLVQLRATLQEHLAKGAEGETRLASLKTAKAYQAAVSNALQKAAELWRGEPLPDVHDVEMLTAMLGQSSDDGPAMNMLSSDDEGSDTEAALGLPTSEDDEEPEVLQSDDDEHEDEEKDEEDQLTEEQIEAFNAERDAVVDAAGDVLALLTGPEVAEVVVTTLWSLIALDVREPLAKRSTAWSQWVTWTSARLDKARPQDGKWLLNDIGDQGLVPSLLLAIRVLQINKINLEPLAKHVLTHMATDAWRPEAVSAAVESLWAMLQPSKPDQEKLSLQLASGFADVIRTANQRDLKEGTNSVRDITAWYVSRAPSGYRDAVCETLIKAIRNVAADRGLFITQLAVSKFTEVEEEGSDKERDKLYGYIRSMVRAVYSRAKVVIGIGSHAQGGLASFTPSQLVQLAELNVAHAQHLPPESQDKQLMEDICKALQGKVHELDQDVQALFVMARVLTAGMYKHEPLMRSIIDRATAVTKTLDPDSLADCVFRQTGTGIQFDTNSLRLFNVTMREAIAKLHHMSVSGLLFMLVGISRLSQQDLPSFYQYVDRVAAMLVVKLDGSGKQTVFTYPNQIAAAAESLHILKHYHPALLQKLALSVATTEQAGRPTALQLSKLLTTLSVLAYDMPETTKTFRACAQRIANNAGSFSSYILIRLCWAYAVANRNPTITPSKSWLDRRGHLVGVTEETSKVTVVHVLLAELITRETLNDSSLHFIMRIWGTALSGVKIPKSMWERVKKFRQSGNVSDTQRELMAKLRSHQQQLGLTNLRMEAPVGREWVVDILAQKGDERVVFEYDGPVHFVRNVNQQNPRVLGNTHIRNICLERLGVKLIAIPYTAGQPTLKQLKDLLNKPTDPKPRPKSRR